MTVRLYYGNSTLKSFDARVIERIDADGRPAVVLDRTAFYPEGGGQPGDRGRLNHVKVVDVISRGDESGDVLHALSEPLADDAVHGAIDWERRFDLMQQHTGQHVLSQSFIRVLDADTVAFHLNDDPHDGTVTIDLNQTALKLSDVEAVEDLANQIVYENRPVTARFVDEAELASIPLRKPPAIDSSIRVVEIADFDWSACGGTHLARTGEIGQIKIVRLERRGAETRIEFRCGQRALSDYRHKNQMISAVAADLSVGFWELDQAVARLLAENKSLHRQLVHAQERIFEFEARELLSDLRSHGDYAVAMRVWHDRDMGTLRKLARQIIVRPGTIALLGSGGEKPALVFARSSDVALDMSALVHGATERIGGKGGGSPDFAQAGGPPASDEQVQSAIEWAYENVMREA